MKTENKRTYSGGFYSPSKRQKPFAESDCNTPHKPNPFPEMSIHKPSGRRRIQWVSKQEVEERLNNGSFTSFNDRWLQFHAIMQGATKRLENSIFIDFDEDLCIRLKQKEDKAFHSKAFDEKMLRDYPESPNPFHRYIKVKECFDGKEITVIKITYSPLGNISELCWIEKKGDATGNKLFEVHEWIQRLLKPRKVLLFDDANLLIKKGSKTLDLPLRYLKVFTSAVAPYKSWYEERGYELYESGEVLFNNGEEAEVFKQSHEKYMEAKKYLRNITLMKLGTEIFVDRINSSMMIQKLFRQFVQKEAPTIADLIQALSLKAKESKEDENAFLIKIHDVFSACLSEWETHKPSLEMKRYIEHFNTFRLARVYVKEL